MRAGWAQAALRFLANIQHFSNLVIKKPLRGYQLEPARAILDSILHNHGREFLIVFPRQAGKNEMVAQLLVYLLNLYQRAGGNIIYGAIGDGLGMGIERLESRLANVWNSGAWSRKPKPTRRTLGNAAVLFLSSHPQASARGQTAHLLMVIDEAQDQDGSHIEAVFTPMRASTNATAVYIGTVKLSTDFLWTKKLELEREERRDGVRRVFLVPPEAVTAENPAYRQFLDTQVRRHGRQHPIIASEYYLEPVDGAGGLFDDRRQALMRGSHERRSNPAPGRLYLATLDLAGEDEAATDPLARLEHPGRDYTVATVFEVHLPEPGRYAPGPTYRAVDVFVDHGSKHFEEVPGRPPLVERLRAWLELWQVLHLVADESGVGLGVSSWLSAALGPHRVTGYNFGGSAKAALGSAFLAVVETGRFQYWTGDEEIPLSDGWLFWQQVKHCTYDLPPEGQFDKHLRWSVPDSARVSTPQGPLLVHDDRLVSAALIAETDRLYRTGNLRLGRAESHTVSPVDPLAGTGDIF